MDWDINREEDPQRVDDRYRPLWQRWYDSLAADELNALSAYKSLAGYFHFAPMRDGLATSDTGAALVKAVDSALDRAAVPHALVVWRGLALWDSDGGLSELQPGQAYLHPGYASASLCESFAVAQTLAGSELEGIVPIILEFWLSAGAPGGYMEPLKPKVTREAEILLPRDRTYRVEAVARTTEMTACDLSTGNAVGDPRRLQPILRIKLSAP